MMRSNLNGDLLGPLRTKLNDALRSPKLEPVYKIILKALESPIGEGIIKVFSPLYIKYIFELFKKIGLPDFQSPIPLKCGRSLLRQLDKKGGTYVIIPNNLQFAYHQNGQLDLKLQLIRSSQTGFPPQPHGCLDLRVEPYFNMAGALEEARGIESSARLITPTFVWGYLHFQTEGKDNLTEKIEPMYLCWNGINTGRIRTQLSGQTSAFFNAILRQGGILPLKVVVEALVIGISPRIPAYVYLNPLKLLERLRTEVMNSDGLLARQDIINFFLRSKAEDMGLDKIEENGAYRKQDFAEAMADRTIYYFGRFVPSPTIRTGPYVKLATPEQFNNSQSTFDQIRLEWSRYWMLDVPIPIGRMYWLPLDMLQAGQQIDNQSVIEELTVPALLDGKVRVQVTVNVPSPRQGVKKVNGLGVSILNSLSLNVIQNIPLPEFGDPDSVDLKFPPKQGDTYEYQYRTHSNLSNQNQTQQTEPKPHIVTNFDADFIYLGSNDFPVAFIPVEATPELLNGARVEGTLQWRGGQSPFTLNSSQPTISLAIPLNANNNNATLEVEIHSTAGVGVKVVKISLPARGTKLTPYNFREFGLQNVEINCTVSGNDFVTYEFQREGDSNIESLWFTSDTRRKTLTYSSYSLFQYQFRYRRKGQSQWSDYIAPFQSLQLNRKS
jgi:hypothetical protein